MTRPASDRFPRPAGNTLPAAEVPSEDPRLVRLAQEYLAQLEAGSRPDRQEFLRRHPDLAGPLAECLDGLELLHGGLGQAARPTPAAPPSPPRDPDPLPADSLGDFRIVREIGRGGMGIVYEALQLSLGRRVALKVLPFAATFDDSLLQRFHNEARAAARLHHSNIVPVHAVGCERGVHFYAMQLIEGQSLSVVIRQLRQQAGRPAAEEGQTASHSSPVAIAAAAPEALFPLSRTFSSQRSKNPAEFFRAAVQLAVQAADALEHAHQFGIVHRDVKPANLLVDVHGRLWVADFGLALFHSDGGLTLTGDVLGTLRYMSPEQASGQKTLLDHRTDVYALGATLYELVTLEPIFSARTRHGLLHQIHYEEPRPPRAVDPAVPKEVETIILKAVSKSPDERYRSARELADDLRRFLDDRPILARRPSLLDRARKWSRRHPSVLVFGVLLLLLSVAGLAVSNYLIAVEQANTRKRAEEAEQRYHDALDAVYLMVQLCDEELTDHPALQGVRRKLLETALGYYQKFLAEHEGDSDLARAQQRAQGLLNELAALKGNLLLLLTQPAVQEHLKLSADQKARLARMEGVRSAEQQKLLRQEGERPAAERREALQRLDRADEKAVAELLTARQWQRLREIGLQAQGIFAFYSSPVVERLALTPAQKERIRQIDRESFLSLTQFGPPPGPHPSGHRKEFPFSKFQPPWRTALRRVLEILTPEQLRQWQDLSGEPFEGPIDLPPDRPFRPR